MKTVESVKAHIATMAARAEATSAPQDIVHKIQVAVAALGAVDGDPISAEVQHQLRLAEGAWRAWWTGEIGAPSERGILRGVRGLLKRASRVAGAVVVFDLEERPEAPVLLFPGDADFRWAIGMDKPKADVMMTLADLLEMARPGAPLREKLLAPVERAMLTRQLAAARKRLAVLERNCDGKSPTAGAANEETTP